MIKQGNIKLACFDMDGVIFQERNFWLSLHKTFGTYTLGKNLTKKYVNSDYEKLVEEVVHKLWKGKDATKYFELVKGSRYIPGVRETFSELRRRGIKTAIVSSGPTHLALRAQKELGIECVYSNELVVNNNRISGEFKWPIGHGNKTKIVKTLSRKLGIRMAKVAFVGEGENDIEVCKAVGLSISFNSESKRLDDVCDLVIKRRDLREILKQL